MIQRIQTVYLFIASLVMALMFFFPISGYYGELHTSMLYLLGIKNMVPDDPSIFSVYTTLPLVFTVVLTIIITVATIFLFKKRLTQLKLIKINIFINIVLIIGIFIVYSRWLQSALEASESFKTGAFLPLVSLVLFLLAYRGVSHDEKLVKASDRLR